MNKKKKTILTLFLTIFCLSLISVTPIFAADDDETEIEANEVPNFVRNHAKQCAARRNFSLGKLKARNEGDPMQGIKVYNGVGEDCTVNLTKAYLFPDEVGYGFSYFNWPKVQNKDQLRVLILMENTIKHCNWKCDQEVETTYTCNKYGDDGHKHESESDNYYGGGTTKVSHIIEERKCNQAAFEPQINAQLGRIFNLSDFFTQQVTLTGGVECTYAQTGGTWNGAAGMIQYVLYYTPVRNPGYQILTLAEGEQYSVIHRMNINGKFLKEQQVWGEGPKPVTNPEETPEVAPEEVEGEKEDNTQEITLAAKAWWDTVIVNTLRENLSAGNKDEETAKCSMIYFSVTGVNLWAGWDGEKGFVRNWDQLNITEPITVFSNGKVITLNPGSNCQEKVIEEYKKWAEKAEDDPDWDKDDEEDDDGD